MATAAETDKRERTFRAPKTTAAISLNIKETILRERNKARESFLKQS